MNGNRVGRHYFVEFFPIVPDITVIIPDNKAFFLYVHTGNPPDIAVVHIFLIVVADLHDLVAEPVEPLSALQGLPFGIERLLKQQVEVRRAHGALVHGRKHLNFIERIKLETTGDVILDQIHDDVRRAIGIVLPHEIEIGKTIL